MMWIVNGLYENRGRANFISKGLIQTDETTWENSQHLENLMKGEKFVLLDWQYARLGGVIPQGSRYVILLLRVMTMDGTVGWIRTSDVTVISTPTLNYWQGHLRMNKIPASKAKEFEVLVGKLLRWHNRWRPLYLPNPKTGRRSTTFHSNIVLKPNELFVVLSMSDASWKGEASSGVRFMCGVKILHPVVGVAWIDYVFENLSELIIVETEDKETET